MNKELVAFVAATAGAATIFAVIRSEPTRETL